MPLYINVSEFIDSIWTFGGSSNGNSNFCKAIVTSKGTTDRDFNMPICVRCFNNIICVLDSGNNRIKLLNEQGQFLRHITYAGLSGTSCTALATLQQSESKFNLLTINWRSKLLCDYEVNFVNNVEIDETKSTLTEYELVDPLLAEPVGIMETANPHLFIVQDNKKLHLCSKSGQIVYESLEVILKFLVKVLAWKKRKESKTRNANLIKSENEFDHFYGKTSLMRKFTKNKMKFSN